MDKLKALEVFVEVAKHKSFNAAAQHLNLSAPAVTRIIANLETELNIKLFQRSTRRVRSTEAGSQFFVRAQNILAEIKDAENEATGNYLSPTGTLTITAPSLFGHRHVMPVVLQYMKAYPRVSVRTFFSDKVTRLAEDDIDIAIRIGHLVDESVYASLVGYVRRIVCASPKYIKKNGKPHIPKDLTNHEIIYPTSYDPSPSWEFFEDNHATRIKLSPKLFCNNKGSAIFAASEGFGLTKAFSYQIHEEFKNGTLEAVLAEFEEPPIPVNIIRLEGQRSTAKVKSFVSFAQQKLSRNPVFDLSSG